MADKYTNIAALTEFLAKVKEWANGAFAKVSHTHTKSQITDFPTIPTKVSQLTNDSGYTSNTGTITGITMNGASKGTSGVVNLGTVITAHQDISGKQDKITAITAQTTQAVYPIKIDTQGHITAYGSAVTIPSEVTESTVSGWGFTKNTGTITGIKMNGSSKGTSGVVDLGTVITSHQDISGKVDKINITAQNTQAVYPVKINAQGQITSYGSAVTSMTPSSHTHGNIQNGGTLQTSDVAIASGDKLVITDSSDSNKVARSSLSFDGSTTTQFLSKKGTFETPTVSVTIDENTTFNISGITFKIELVS